MRLSPEQKYINALERLVTAQEGLLAAYRTMSTSRGASAADRVREARAAVELAKLDVNGTVLVEDEPWS